jgi:hypothetical protein
MNTIRQIRSSRGSFTRARRDFVIAIAVGFEVLSLQWSLGQRVLAGRPEPTVERIATLVATENRKSGSTDWQLTRIPADRDGFRSPWIEGYCSRQSVKSGGAQGLSSPPGHTLPWSHWSRRHGPDERVQKVTHNLLRRAIRRGP